jgi:DNA-binding NtrC family response regulator
VSLFLITKDVKLRSALNRQFGMGCHWVGTSERFAELKRKAEDDNCPVILMDEDFCEHNPLVLIEGLLALKIPGTKILLTGRLATSKHHPFLIHNSFGILRKPFSADQLIEGLITNGKEASLAGHLNECQLEQLRRTLRIDRFSSELVGASRQMVLVRNIIAKIGSSFRAVHINGETGTGKEVVASLLRREASQSGPFVIVNCSSIPGTLADTYLFGNERGAYTDAKQAHEGVVKSADGGLLFLDEIEDLAKEVQGKLLRLLETKKFRPLGSDRVLCSDFKLITASNVPLAQLCKKGSLRFDLYNRLNRLVINLPPLREHKTDIPLLIGHHLASIGERRRPDRDTMGKIMAYHWPGNVRELFKELDLLSVFAPTEAKSLSYREILTESALSRKDNYQDYGFVSQHDVISQL